MEEKQRLHPDAKTGLTSQQVASQKEKGLKCMHELGVVFHIIDDLKAVASDNDVSSISKVTIELGEVSGVVEEYLTDCWRWACKKEELVKDCEMEVEIIPGITYCEDCGETYETVKYAKVCPNCGSKHTYLIQGNEFNIKQIEVPE